MRARIAKMSRAALALSTSLFALPAGASDYSNTCVSGDGRYVMDDGLLLTTEAYKTGDTSGKIEYTVRHEKVYSLEEGECIDWKRSPGGKGTRFEAKRYTLSIAFQHSGEPRQADMRCFLYGDGLPASWSCDRRVVAKRIGTPEVEEKGWGVEQEGLDKPVVTAWTHNGSDMKLIATGDQRTFSYVRPRSILEPNGVYPGTMLFSGSSDGRVYTGTARIFTRRCGELSFDVKGPIERGGSRVVLRGKAPKPGPDCRPAAWRDEVLVFEMSKGP